MTVRTPEADDAQRATSASVVPDAAVPGVVTEVPWTDTTATVLRREMFERTNLRLYPDGFGHLTAPGAWEADDAAIGATALTALVAHRDGVALGGAGLRAPGEGVPTGSFEVVKVYVRPEARRTGVASALLDAADTVARRHGAQALVLGTGPLQPEAVATYLRHGYTEIDPYPPYDSYGDARCFRKGL